MKYVVLLIPLALTGCFPAQGKFHAQSREAVVDVSTLRATDITISECDEGEGQTVEIRPRSVIDIDAASEAIAKVAALMCGL